MLLSRLTLRESAARSASFWSLTRDQHATHAAVWRLFADHPDRRRDFLYRLDAPRGRPQLWTLSERPPVDAEALWRLESRRLEPALSRGDRLDFSVRVNPTVCRGGKRHDVVMDTKLRTGWRARKPEERPLLGALVQQALEEWIRRRQEGHGFGLSGVLASGYRVLRFRKPSGRTVQMGVVDLQGTLEVVEPARFLTAWRHGLGPAKGYGCGLLLLRRARR